MIDEMILRHEHDCMMVGVYIWGIDVFGSKRSFGFTSLMAWVFIVYCMAWKVARDGNA